MMCRMTAVAQGDQIGWLIAAAGRAWKKVMNIGFMARLHGLSHSTHLNLSRRSMLSLILCQSSSTAPVKMIPLLYE